MNTGGPTKPGNGHEDHETKNLSTPEDVLAYVRVNLEDALMALGQLDAEDPRMRDPKLRREVATVDSLALELSSNLRRSLPEAPFKLFRQLIPSPEARFFIEKAKRISKEEIYKKRELVDNTFSMLLAVFSVRIPELKHGKDSADERLLKIKTFAERYAHFDGLDVSKVVDIFSKVDGEFFIGLERSAIESSFRDKKVVEMVNNPDISVFRSGVLPSKFFGQLMSDKVSSIVMDIDRTWQSRRSEGGRETFLAGFLNQAKEYVKDRFGETFLTVEFRAVDSLAQLQKLAQTQPLDEKSYVIFKKAQLLLRVMRIMILHSSEIDESMYAANSSNLSSVIDEFCIQVANFTYINPPRDVNGNPRTDFVQEDGLIADENGMKVDRIEVAEDVKLLHAIVDKILRKELYDTTEIGDIVRMRGFLCEEDCFDEDGAFNPEKVEKALSKFLGIIISIFGNEIDLESLDYSVDTGKTNEASKGSHRGIHVNIKFKSSCNANGLILQCGEPISKAIDAEIQLLVYMSKDNYKADTGFYEKSRKRVLAQKLGIETGFNHFVLDLISALSNDQYKFEFESTADPYKSIEGLDEESRKVYERQSGIGEKALFPESVDLECLLSENRVLFSPDKLRLLVLLLAILTKTDSKGDLINKQIFEYMEKYFPNKLGGLMDKYFDLLQNREEFKAGGKLAYLKRILEAKIRFVKNVKSFKGGMTRAIFSTYHKLKISGSGKGCKNPVKLTFVTGFSGGRSKNPYEMEIPYDSPVDIDRKVIKPDEEVDFCWINRVGKSSSPVYKIEKSGDEVTCYLLSGERRIPLWIIQPDYSHGYDYNSDFERRSIICAYVHGVEVDPETNKPMLVVKDLDLDSAQSVVTPDFNSLRPSTGLDRKQARFINLVYKVGAIWREVASRTKNKQGVEEVPLDGV
ncbi:MAG: hypothetical protein PHP74_01280 [Candidatus Gracilibacteria bacterium]|nr:hypothetical protein [Candidatus Gracilibacteria bacterium]